MFLFILESIGMQELLLVGIVALIVFGPRKLPEMAKMIGKTMAEFRRVTGEFKETWEKEASFEGNLENKKETSYSKENVPKRIVENSNIEDNTKNVTILPEIKEINATDFDKNPVAEKKTVEQVKVVSDKKNWL